MEQKWTVIGIIAIVAIAGFILNDAGYFDRDESITPTTTPTTPTTPTTTTPRTDVQVLTGDFNIKVQVIDTNDQTIPRVDGTNINILYYQLKDNDWLWKGTSSATVTNQATFGLDETLMDVHAMLEIPEGQDFLVDLIKTNNQYSRIGTAIWADPDDDGIIDPVIPIDILGIQPVGNDPPTLNWTVYLHSDDGTNITLTSPPDADTDNLGLGRADCAIDWELEFSTNASAFLVKSVEVIVNGTNDDIYSLTNSYVDVNYASGSERITLNRMNPNTDNFNNEIEYKKTFGDGEVEDAKLYQISTSQNILKRGIAVNLETDFGASETGLNVSLNVGLMDAQGELHQTVTDTVFCAK